MSAHELLGGVQSPGFSPQRLALSPCAQHKQRSGARLRSVVSRPEFCCVNYTVSGA